MWKKENARRYRWVKRPIKKNWLSIKSKNNERIEPKDFQLTTKSAKYFKRLVDMTIGTTYKESSLKRIIINPQIQKLIQNEDVTVINTKSML